MNRTRSGFFGLETLLCIGLLAIVGLCSGVRHTGKAPTVEQAAGTVANAAVSQIGR
jgi:hypothetical protein